MSFWGSSAFIVAFRFKVYKSCTVVIMWVIIIWWFTDWLDFCKNEDFSTTEVLDLVWFCFV